jgi:hypothetical protein
LEDLRERVAESHNSLILNLKPYLYGLTACLTLLLFAITGVEALFNKSIRQPLATIEGLQNEILETYLEDSEYLESSQLASSVPPTDSKARSEADALTESAKLTDAGPTLNRLVYWYPPANIGPKAPLVDPKSREFLMRYQDDWIKGRTFLERGNIKADIRFFKELSRFQIWDVEKNSPIANVVSRGEFLLPSKLPTPETLDLLTAVKVRLMQGSIDSNAVEALKDVRKFAMLLLTTENFQLVMTGLTVLDLERRAYREYVDRDWLDPDMWQPIDRNTSMRAARAYTATAGYLRALTREAVFDKIFSTGKIPPGFCAAINEQLPMEYAYRSQLTGLWPFERSFRPGFKRLDRTFEFAKKHCRLALLSKLAEEDAFGGIEPQGPWPLTHVPYFRGLFALRDWVAWPTHLEGYQRH